MIYPQSSWPLPEQAPAPGVPANPSFPDIELRVLDYWQADGTFVASVEARPAGTDGSNEFVFYDGPPFANGLPHYGHLLTGYVKDVVPRYQTMRGRRVERRFGWDTHGLPAELEAQRLLGIATKKDILDMGIESFNRACHTSVLRYTDDWREYVTRQARWVDFDNDYKTLNPEYMESVIWAFKTLYDKGLVYQGHRVLPYCWNDETPLSNHELRMDDDVYQPRQDPSVTFWVELETGERLLAWTTTPWTLPSNLAMAVGEDIDYVAVRATDDPHGPVYLLAEARLGAYARELGVDAGERVVARYSGRDLVGRRYHPLFDTFADAQHWGTEAAFRILANSETTTEDGTGVVHMAPAYGEVDQNACDAAGIPTLLTVDEQARFTPVVPWLEGLQVFEANRPVINQLKARGVLLREESYVHSYPHCWRCRTPLIYKAVTSWFVEVTAFRDRMVELNEQIQWVPEHVKHGQFGTWLSNARDWSISRNRFWGAPIPVWRSDDPAYPRVDAYGSFTELERDFGQKVTDLHRPAIDELVRPNPDDPRPDCERSTMRRVPEVLDCWFESGSMSFAQVHYPFENKDWFDHHYPGDFIVEYIGQTRGWFYTMHILATALFDRPSFSSCLAHGIVLGNDGQKMSKSLRNYPDVTDVFDRDGADAMRWFLMSSPILRGGNLIVTEQGIREGVRQALLPLWSTWYFFTLYANSAAGGAGYRASWSSSSRDVLDRYVLAKLHELVAKVQHELDAYDIAGACDSVRGFLDVLTNWYVRRSRSRFWDVGDMTGAGGAGASGGADRARATAAFDTLYTCLEVVTRVAAPLLPMTTEEIWRGLTGGRSVHLTDWPDAADLPADHALVARMDRAREICSVASSLRKAERLRVRLPLAELTVVTVDADALRDLADIIADEVNVKSVTLTDLSQAAGTDVGITQRLIVNAKAAGPRLGRDVQHVIRASKAGDWQAGDDGVVCGGIALRAGEYTLETVVDQPSGVSAEVTPGTDRGDGTGRARQARRASAVLAGGGFLVLDTEVTPELSAEGLARDVIRVAQQARREAGLEVSDRISLSVLGDDAVWRAVVAHQQLIMAETLARQFGAAADLDALPETEGLRATVGDGQSVRVIVTRL
ncbi:MAG TPA: isoleucine--tRNA ligase [Dermatophilaceae bacterium]|nr:isoleucine--tRNA ligase [Dermatophilaceae bacterium]